MSASEEFPIFIGGNIINIVEHRRYSHENNSMETIVAHALYEISSLLNNDASDLSDELNPSSSKGSLTISADWQKPDDAIDSFITPDLRTTLDCGKGFFESLMEDFRQASLKNSSGVKVSIGISFLIEKGFHSDRERLLSISHDYSDPEYLSLIQKKHKLNDFKHKIFYNFINKTNE